MMNATTHRVEQLGYVLLDVSDLEAWEGFATGILGLMPRRTAGGELALRMDEYRQRFLLTEGSKDDLKAAGWEVPDQRALEGIAEQLSRAGHPIETGSAEECARRSVSHFVHTRDPSGIRVEIYCGARLVFEAPFHSPRPLSRFVTGAQGLGHIVLAVDDAEASLAFYRDVLGLRETDFVSFGHGRHEMNITFMHCNPRHHSLAFLEAPLPRRLHHLMLQVAELDDVGVAYSLCRRNEVPLASTLGRHTNDHMVSFYVRSPSGFEIEYGWGARTIDDRTWKVQTHRAPSIWGHERAAG